MTTLSLTIPTFNEAAHIRIPLDSAYDLVDEIVIVDGGSTDDTVQIAKSYGEKVHVYEVDNPPNFLINKQRAIDKAHGQWVLQLDADEALSPELKKEIVSLLKNTPPDVPSGTPLTKRGIDNGSPLSISGYWIPRKNWFLGRYLMKGGVYPDAVLRLYKKEGAHFELKDLHENVTVAGETGYLDHAILHQADPNFERYLMRWNRYTTFDAQELRKAGKTPSVFSYFIGKPIVTFFSIYVRHQGFRDGFPGFVWALFSSIRFWAIYVKAVTMKP